SGIPELMADYACIVRDAGARIIGGCCGTTSEHVRRMREALDTTPSEPKPDIAMVEARLGQVTDGARSLCLHDVLEQAQPRRKNRRQRRVN
ncbi:MAG: homocysteine S-methyltransferase family protein, partial [Gammaproteobacteria bacterium]|nr:homocysteine S-methyltransferase family protein [Gammaproteobacteria bacterium]